MIGTGTTLDLTLSTQLQTELGQAGVYAYAVVFDKAGGDTAIEPVTTLVNNGTVVNGGSAEIALTDGSGTMDGGKVYFVIQSIDPADSSTLAHDITSQAWINPGNASGTADFGYDSVEVALLGTSSDAANLTSVNGFGLPMALSVEYDNATSASVGYGISGSVVAGSIAASGTDSVASYAAGPLAGDFRMSTSPSEANDVNTGTVSTGGAYPESAWLPYIGALENTAVANGITISGQFNGAADAAGVWHNGGYYAYQLQWDGSAFWLVASNTSQIKGDIRLTPDQIAENIYAQLGTVEIYNGTADVTPAFTVGVGDNTQWGAVLAQFLTGFTGGYYGEAGVPLNSQAGGTVSLGQNYNWDPTYAFGHDGSNTLGLSGNQVFDPYSKIFFDASNSYGSPYSDALMSQYSQGGPLLTVSQPGTTADVGTIDVTLFADGETPTGYTVPTIANYIAPGGTAYAVPTTTGSGANVELNFASAVADNEGISLSQDATVTLRVLTGDAGGVPSWATIAFDTAAAADGAGLWQQWTISADGSGGYTAAPFLNDGTVMAEPTGSMLLLGFPTALSGVSWYQVTVGSGAAAKTYNLYATTGSGGLFENPAYSGQSGALAIDGLATITPQVSAAQYVPTFTVDFAKGDTVTYDPSLAVEMTGSVASGGTVSWNSFPVPPPTAPVVGVVSGGTFTAEAGQNNENSNTITVTTDGEFQFGWTGLNAGSASWVSGYTNKTNAGDFAVVRVSNGLGTTATLTAQADLDGAWQTASGVELGNGTYTVTMQDYVPSGGEPGAPVTSVSDALVMTVDDPDNANGGGTIVVVPCFRRGTRLATPDGAVAVEALRVGDRLITAGGEVAPIVWIGRRVVDCARHRRPVAVWPVRVAAGAFGAGVPERDVFLSPDHAVYAEEVLVPVKHLINGTSVAQVEVAWVEYFHVELAAHDVVLADGLPVESYLDTGDRVSFGGETGVVALHPAWGSEARDVTLVMEAAGCAPLVVTGPEVAALRARLGGCARPSSWCRKDGSTASAAARGSNAPPRKVRSRSAMPAGSRTASS